MTTNSTTTGTGCSETGIGKRQIKKHLLPKTCVIYSGSKVSPQLLPSGCTVPTARGVMVASCFYMYRFACGNFIFWPRVWAIKKKATIPLSSTNNMHNRDSWPPKAGSNGTSCGENVTQTVAYFPSCTWQSNVQTKICDGHDKKQIFVTCKTAKIAWNNNRKLSCNSDLYQSELNWMVFVHCYLQHPLFMIKNRK